MTISSLERMYAHMAWANQRVLDLLTKEPAGRAQPAVRLLAHLIAAEQIWLLRLRGKDSSGIEVWPDHDLEQLSRQARANEAEYRQLIRSVADEGDPIREVAYARQGGDSQRNQILDILIHVALHGSYHRGQIAARIRSAGGEPTNTDYLTFARELRDR